MKTTSRCTQLFNNRSLLTVAFAITASLLPGQTATAASGTWNSNSGTVWSGSTSWLSNVIADGAGDTADFSQFNITGGTRTVTIDGAVSSRTVGTLLIGDADATDLRAYTIAASGGGTLTFNNNGSAALLNQVTGQNTISAPIILADNLNITNSGTSVLTISGNISGSKLLTNSGTGSGGVTISGTIASGVTGMLQNSQSSVLTLSASNQFSTGVEIRQGTVIANNNGALGSGTVLLGGTSGSADATLLGNSFTLANPITVRAGSSGALTIASNGNAAARPSGNILLNNNLNLEVSAGGFGGRSTGAFLATSGTISGTGNLILNVHGGLTTGNDGGASHIDSLNVVGPIQTSGTIINSGTGSGRAIISGNISNAAALNQNSATSQLSLSGSNNYSGATNVNAGVLRITTNSALSANSSSVNVADGATLQLTNGSTALNAGQTLNIAGFGTSYSYGAVESTNVANYAGNIVLLADSAVSSDLANTTLTLSGTMTGSGKTLTSAGIGSVTVSGPINTGTGGVIKLGAGTLTLSAANTYTGLTSVKQGMVLLSHTNALAGGGAITLDGGALQHSSSNELDYGSRIVNSTGPVSLDTNGRNVTYSGIAASNIGGVAKLGSGRLTLAGTNSFSGPIAVNAGVLAVSDISALPTTGTGLIFIDANGALNTGGAYADVQAWLDSDNIATTSTGAIALTGNNAGNIDFSGYSGLNLGASSNASYTGTITPAGALYRLGGGGATLTMSNTNALTGTNGLVVSSGNVTLTEANDLTGATTVASNTLTLSFHAGLAASNVTVSPGATLAITTDTGTTAVNRASSVTLSRGNLTLTGNSSGNSTDVITNALTIGAGGNSIVTLNQANAKNVLLTSGSLVREAGSSALIRGANLGVNTLASVSATSSNISLATPILVGGTGGNITDRGILVGVVGDTSSGGTGFAATGGLLTSDTTYGVRLLSGTEYKTSITDGQTQLDNVQLSSSSGTATTTVNAATTINSLSLKTSAVATAAVAVTGTGKLTLSSGMIYSNSVTASAGNTVGNTINFNNREGLIFIGGSTDLSLSGVLEGTDGKGLTVYAPSRTVTFSGTASNTYTGTTNVNGGTLTLSKTAGLDAIAGNLVINSGASVTESASNQIADGASVTINGGSLTARNETMNNLSVISGGSINYPSNTRGIVLNVNGDLTISGASSTVATNIQGGINVSGTTTLSDGGLLALPRSQSSVGDYDSVVTLNGALNITNTASGEYTALRISHGSSLGQSGGLLVLGGNVTFTGNSTNANTVLIDAIKGSGRQGQIMLTGSVSGNRTFTVGNGAAGVDLRITAPLVDGTAGASGVIKAGLGTLELTGVSTYTGATAVNAGVLKVGASAVLAAATGTVTVQGGKLDSGVSSAQIGGALTMTSGTLSINGSSAGGFTLASTKNFTMSGGTFSLQLGTAFDAITSAGGAAAFNISGGTFALDVTGAGFSYGNTYQVFSGFSGSNSVAGLSFTGYNTGAYTASLSNTGVLSFLVIPEPTTFAMLISGLGMLTLFRRRSSRIS